MQIRLTLADKVIDAIDKEAEKLGMDRNDYIKMVLGQHILNLKQQGAKK